MKQNKLFLGLATMFAAAFAFTSCSSDDTESQSTQQDHTIRLVSTLEKGGTRSTSDPQAGTSLSTSSSLGVFAINNSTALTNGNNEPYSVDGSGNLNPNTTANTMAWPESGNVSFYAYAPFVAGANYYTANSFSVQTDQTTEANYLASDLVLAKNENVAKTESAVELSFNHLMAKVNITIQKATNATVDLTNAKVSIINTQPTCTFKPNATGSGDDKVLGAASGDVTEITLVSALGTATTACGIIVPQTLAANTGLVKIQTAPGTANNRILIAKLSAETTFASGQSYNFTAEIDDPAAPITYITLKLGSTNLVAWGNNELGASTKDFCLGDYILSDGSLLKANDVDFATKKANVVAVIFSNNVCENDASLGYDGYAVSIEGKLSTNNLAWATSNELVGTAVNTPADALSDYIGLARRNAFSSDFTTHPAFQCTGAPALTGDNLSAWFIPSMAQFVDIIQNLGEVSDIRSTINTAYNDGQTSNNNISVPKEPVSSFLSFLSKINAYAVTVKGSGNVIITASGDGSSDSSCFGYVTASERDASNMWMIKFPAQDAANQRIYLSRGAPKTGDSNRNVLPIIAFKVK